MILVTVGTTMPFDELLAEVDRLAGNGTLSGKVLCQTGQSAYTMRHTAQVRSLPSLDDLIGESRIVITHGGATVIQLLAAGRPFVAFANPRGAGDHQSSFLSALAEACPISWSREVCDLERLYTERERLGPVRMPATFPRASAVINDILAEDDRAHRKKPLFRTTRNTGFPVF